MLGSSINAEEGKFDLKNPHFLPPNILGDTARQFRIVYVAIGIHEEETVLCPEGLCKKVDI